MQPAHIAQYFSCTLSSLWLSNVVVVAEFQPSRPRPRRAAEERLTYRFQSSQAGSRTYTTSTVTFFSNVMAMTQSVPPKYTYKPLQHKDSIRLIELLPGPAGSPLACHISEVQKSNLPQYEAISYVWGNPVFSHVVKELTPDSHTNLYVTANLYNALHAVRDEHTPRTIWADGLCINQSDIKERGHQVAFMGQIFQDATRVIVWLGSTRGDPKRVIPILENVVQAMSIFEGLSDFGHVIPQRIHGVCHRLFVMGLFESSW